MREYTDFQGIYNGIIKEGSIEYELVFRISISDHYVGQVSHKYENVIKNMRSSNINGWIDKQKTEFVIGEYIYNISGEKEKIEYTGATLLEPEGKFDSWKKIFLKYMKDPQAVIVCGACAISPFLDVIKLPSFVLDIWGFSGRGKSLITMLGASLFGDPNRMLKQWRSTAVGSEMHFVESNSIPVMLDDAQEQKDEIKSDIIYKFVSLTTKTRGTIRNNEVMVAKDKNWRTIMISTSENAIVDSNPKGGLLSRVLEVKRKTEESTELALEADEDKRLLCMNYGFLGEKIIHFIFNNKEKLAKQHEKNTLIVQKIFLEKPNAPTRHVNFWASILTGIEMLTEILQFSVETKPILDEIMESLGESGSRKLDEKLYDFIISLFNSQEDKFINRSDASNSITQDKIFEKWGAYEEKFGLFKIMFFTHKLKEQMAHHDYKISYLKFLKEKGLMECDNNRIDKYVTLPNKLGISKKVRMYVFVIKDLNKINKESEFLECETGDEIKFNWDLD